MKERPDMGTCAASEGMAVLCHHRQFVYPVWLQPSEIAATSKQHHSLLDREPLGWPAFRFVWNQPLLKANLKSLKHAQVQRNTSKWNVNAVDLIMSHKNSHSVRKQRKLCAGYKHVWRKASATWEPESTHNSLDRLQTRK